MDTDFELKADFRTEVLEASRETPVLVDFWAEWCGPCRVLSPILEKLAAESRGRWKLVKVDTERHQDLARVFDIRGIPAVKLFSQGDLVAEFAGALPEDRIRAWLDEHLPGPSDDDFNAGVAAFEAGELETARTHLEQALARDGADHRARLFLARLLFLSDPEAAARLASEIPEEDEGAETAAGIATLAAFVKWGTEAPEESRGSTDDPVDRYRDAARRLGEGDLEKALEELIGLVGTDRKLDEDGARRMAVAIFSVLGESHPLTRRFRARLASALY